MSGFFTNFPKVYYDLLGIEPVSPIVVTNILPRIRMLTSIRLNSYVYYSYDIKDTDTPEIIADKYYGDPNRNWIVLMANDIIDPYYDWPLRLETFAAYVEGKYGSIAASEVTINAYQKTISTLDSSTGLTTDKTYSIDQTTYNALPTTSFQVLNLQKGGTVSITITKSILYAFDYEDQINEAKRNIAIIDKVYVPQLEKELKALLTN